MRNSFLIIACFLSLNLFGQGNNQVQFGYRGSISAARFLPSTHSLDSNNFEISISYKLWAASSSLSYGSLQTIFTDSVVSNSDIDDIISQMDDENKIALGQDFLILGIGFKHKFIGKPLLWSFSISDRFIANALYPKSLPQLMWQGNRQFEGEAVDLSSTVVAGLYFREFALGATRNIYQSSDFSVIAGVRLNYYTQYI